MLLYMLRTAPAASYNHTAGIICPLPTAQSRQYLRLDASHGQVWQCAGRELFPSRETCPLPLLCRLHSSDTHLRCLSSCQAPTQEHKVPDSLGL
ncbi:hypothetical protein BKA66DRAFT_462988 [Pyrenochaeta sp. MPI-SDFR-AT-0127]|nr:hypothetical protein BKA66DRAFT_462988 [Pyrenochaeta sp. MPI-SDFR-AT-0127]